MRTRYGTHSVYWRLLVIYAVTCALIILVLGGGFKYAIKPRVILKSAIIANVQAYTDSLIREIGTPPSIDMADSLGKRLGLDIQIWGPGIKWRSSPDLPSLEDYKQKYGHIIQGLNAGRVGTRWFYFEPRGEFVYVVSVSNGPIQWVHYEMGMIALLVILTVLAGSFVLLRLLLKPIRVLISGITEVGRGNFDYRIHAGHRDEFAEIGAAFNQMTGHVREMLVRRERLLVDVSHELRTPLTRIRLALEMPSSDWETARDSIAEDVQELDGMIKDLLESSRLEALHGQLKKERVACNALIESVTGGFEEENSRLRFKSKENSGENFELYWFVDVARMKMLLNNLIENALKQSSADAGPVEISVAKNGKWVELLVCDHGPGVPESEKERIFEAFYRIDGSRNRETGGVGIGLSLCRKIATAHEGTIHVEDAPGGGACFIVRIPDC
ncbi:MAG: HAMP domain-containing histidine kinase [Deltaproteobacteria bacterium]|nr:HAMP domain-containing histidine kinase [Deltaproteobacteria bacterium]